MIERGRAEIARREAERLDDPIKTDDFQRSERQGEVIEKDAGAADLIFKTVARPAPTVSADVFTPEQSEALQIVINELRNQWCGDIERKFCMLAADIIRLDSSINGTDAPVYLPKGFLGPRR